MNIDQRQVIKSDIEAHVSRVLREKRNVSESLKLYMDSSNASKSFFDNTDVDELLAKYEEELIRVSEALGNKTFSRKQKILNFLEYVRMTGMYENLDTDKLFQELSPLDRLMIRGGISGISQHSGINIAVLGKGVCVAQASFLRDLLIASGEEATTKEVFRINKKGIVMGSHSVVYAPSSSDSSISFLDVTFYNGGIDRMKKSFDYWTEAIREEQKSLLSLPDITEKEIELARNTVQEYLIERFKIKDISTQLGIPEASDLDKQILILTFMEKHLAPTSLPLLWRSVCWGNREIECGKLLELFYRANNIPYILECENDKSDSRYIVTMEGRKCIIDPKQAFSNTRNDEPLTNKLHYVVIEENGQRKFKYVWELSEEMLEKYKDSITKAREIAKKAIIPEQETGTNLRDTHRQFVNSIIVDVSPTETSRNIQSDVQKGVTYDGSGQEIDET